MGFCEGDTLMRFQGNDRTAHAIVATLIMTAGFTIGDGFLTPSYAIPAKQATTMPAFQLAQTTPTLTERPDQIDTCRGVGNSALAIYKNTGLNGVIGTAPANSSVTLTGVFGPDIAQIRLPKVGWVSSPLLKTDCSGTPPEGGLPSDLDTNPKYCRRLRSSQTDGSAYSDLDSGLVARNAPNGDIQFVGDTNQPDGPARAAIVRFPGRASDIQDAAYRRWIRVKYIGVLGTPRLGWVTNGPTGTNRNIATCF